MEKLKNIGWIGLGAMGIPMALNLLKAGYNLTVYNRTKEKEKKLTTQGALPSESPGSVMESNEIVIVMVSDDEAVRQIFTGIDGLLSASTQQKIIINMSTVSPEISAEMVDLCKEKNHTYVDAPVSGSVKQAEEASLVILAGGDKQVFEQTKPLLSVLGKKVMHLGEITAGNKTKLAVNTFLAIVTQGLAETVLFAEKMGIERKQILEAIGSGGLSSPYTEIKSKAIEKDNYPAAFALKHMAKDLRLATGQHLSSPLGKAAFNTYENAKEKLGEEDVMAVIKAVQA